MTTSAAAFAYPGPDNISRTVLENGLVTLIRENRSAPITVVEGYLPTGNIHDPADLAGLSAFVAGMLTRGSEQYDFAAFNEAVEGAGASLSFHSDCHVTNFGLRCLSENFADLLAILADAMRRPTFPDPLVERLRNQKLIGLQEREQDTAAMANLAEGVQGLVKHMRSEQQMIRDWVEAQSENQRELKEVLERLSANRERL